MAWADTALVTVNLAGFFRYTLTSLSGGHREPIGHSGGRHGVITTPDAEPKGFLRVGVEKL